MNQIPFSRDLQKKYRSVLIVAFIFFVALFFRVSQLGSLPNGLHEDEMMNGYVGRFILQNGKDLYGNSWPLLYFNNFGDYPPVIPMYLSGLSTYVFGVTPFAVRFPIAVFGSLTIIPIYLLAKMIFLKERYASAAAFFLAVSPWHILLSRATAENITASFFMLTALYFLLSYQKTRKISHLLLMGGLTLAKYFLYASFRVTSPISLFAAIFLSKDKNWRATLLILSIIFALTTLLIGRTEWGRGRFKQTSILYFNNTINNRITNMEIEEGSSNVYLARIFHNKGIVIGREFIRQYLSYFSPNFLFTDGGLPHRYLMEDHGLLYIAFLLILGVAVIAAIFFHEHPNKDIFTPNGRRLFGYILCVLVVSPIPAALTLDDVPNIHRATLLGILLIFPITYALACCEHVKWKQFHSHMIIAAVLGFEIIYFWHQFSIHTIAVQSEYRGDDRTTLAKFLNEHHTEYDIIYLPHDAKPLYYLFEKKNFDPSLAGKFRENISLDHIDNLIFTASNCSHEVKDLRVTRQSLIISRANCITPEGFEQTQQILRGDKTGSFRLFQMRKI